MLLEFTQSWSNWTKTSMIISYAWCFSEKVFFLFKKILISIYSYIYLYCICFYRIHNHYIYLSFTYRHACCRNLKIQQQENPEKVKMNSNSDKRELWLRILLNNIKGFSHTVSFRIAITYAIVFNVKLITASNWLVINLFCIHQETKQCNKTKNKN